jgi:hypothetical protein
MLGNGSATLVWATVVCRFGWQYFCSVTQLEQFNSGTLFPGVPELKKMWGEIKHCDPSGDSSWRGLTTGSTTPAGPEPSRMHPPRLLFLVPRVSAPAADVAAVAAVVAAFAVAAAAVAAVAVATVAAVAAAVAVAGVAAADVAAIAVVAAAAAAAVVASVAAATAVAAATVAAFLVSAAAASAVAVAGFPPPDKNESLGKILERANELDS